MTKRLWDADHPYYCHVRGPHDRPADDHPRFESWADFVAETRDWDPDYHLLFRWDWDFYKESGKHELSLFYMLQRKGGFTSRTVAVTPADEPAIRAWLTERARHMVELWAPLLNETQLSPHT